MDKLPEIIQGGMGVGVSSVELARAIAMNGQLGVISGTALAVTMVRKLQDPSMNKEIINAIKTFPYRAIAARILDAYLPKTDTTASHPYPPVPMPSLDMTDRFTELTVVANYVEVYLAKKGHSGVIGINLLEKIQIPTLPSVYGAMLAGVDYVLMGAGIPIRMPWVLDQFSHNLEATLPIQVLQGTETITKDLTFSPTQFAKGEKLVALKRPKFLAIVASATLALHLSRSEFGSPDGFVVEMPTAGGHNAPPRGKMILNEQGEPIYGVRDEVDMVALNKVGKPFWLGGGYGNREGFLRAKNQGATGIQVGTAFAFCAESGLTKWLKEKVVQALFKGKANVKTDPLASPTGFPFKVVELEGTIGEAAIYEKRPRICDLGYLRVAYLREDGKIGYRCPSEPIQDYLRKGGKIEDTLGRKCLCNGLVASIGLGQKRADGQYEIPLLTAGDDLKWITQFLKVGQQMYHAVDVLIALLGTQLQSPIPT